jgi:hypothetical protein
MALLPIRGNIDDRVKELFPVNVAFVRYKTQPIPTIYLANHKIEWGMQ